MLRTQHSNSHLELRAAYANWKHNTIPDFTCTCYQSCTIRTHNSWNSNWNPFHVGRYFLFDTPTFYSIVFGFAVYGDSRSTGIDRLLKSFDRLFAICTAFQGAKGNERMICFSGNSPMVGREPTGCNTTICSTKKAGKGANKNYSGILVNRLCEMHIAMVDGFSLPSCTI